VLKEIALRQAETDRQLDKNAKDTENLRKTIERVSQNAGGLNRSLGELIETLIAARLWEKFPGYNFKRAYQRMPVFDEKSRVLTDIDILPSNTGVAMAVGVVDPDAQRYAYENSLYVLELSDETVRLLPDPEGFEPK
jgi:hypothetical protein